MKQLLHKYIRPRAILSSLALALISSLTIPAAHAEDATFLQADLVSVNQVPAVLTPAWGRFEAEVQPDSESIQYRLSYFDTSSAVSMAHIHFGASKTNGGIIVFLCGGPKPACPASGTITGTLTAADVSVLPATNPDSVIPQGIEPGAFGALLKAILTGNGYVNVHTAKFPSGEIRGQVKVR